MCVPLWGTPGTLIPVQFNDTTNRMTCASIHSNLCMVGVPGVCTTPKSTVTLVSPMMSVVRTEADMIYPVNVSCYDSATGLSSNQISMTTTLTFPVCQEPASVWLCMLLIGNYVPVQYNHTKQTIVCASKDGYLCVANVGVYSSTTGLYTADLTHSTVPHVLSVSCYTVGTLQAITQSTTFTVSNFANEYTHYSYCTYNWNG